MIHRKFNAPDLHAKRFRINKFSLLDKRNYRAFMTGFKKAFPEHKKYKATEISKTIKEFHQYCCDTAIRERDGIQLPEHLGWIFIGTCQPAYRRNVNMALSKEYGVNLANRNFESDSYLAKIFYSNYNNKYLFKNRKYWTFKGAREFTRKVSKEYPENWQRYVKIDRSRLVSKQYKINVINQKRMKQEKNLLTDYNEFDLD